ncbi:murein biosynthesis integral membrane protein MurJ [Candidatus Beckwithbacteria bacterium CG10_big_fil_rev_8_21_14_0_10_34_10]|uniref:Probable lipid II flippase MurJ n=1 Tax=Candidatus Beckwithbacteria bacterium CG10_big_fil_rev_8_21_14_0_10_34_10 TaxID=1974495 RepID=A0A2H0W9H7_9BACT|nr:MAG: murein biosynthesis integral membrane protein MurJ [Candidatus Beckwithbacteria bacterium CG10_big_fil_rev_8_21_14_0_10_34_10]
MKAKNNILRNGALILLSRQTNILSAATVIMVNVAASRILGLIRDRLLASYFGSSATLGVYFAAFRLPDMIFQLLVMGALATAFIPVMTSLISKKKKELAWQVASSVLNIGLVGFFVLSIFICFYAKKLSQLIAPGFNQEELVLMANLTRVMIVAQFFFILSNYLTGILQSFKRFLIPALAPVLYNLGIIVGIIFLSPKLGIYGPALGVIIGTFLHFIIQLPQAKSLGLKYRLTFNWRQKEVKEIGRLMLPRTIGLAVSQIDYTVDVALASLISASSLIYLNFAQHLQLLPVGLFGATIAQAALPTLAEEGDKKDLGNFKKTLSTSFQQIIFLVMPFSVLLIILRVPVVRLVFGAARFDWQATLLTGQVLAFFSLSLFAQAAVHILARAFYALRDTKTPVFIGALSVLTNVFTSIYFILVLKLPVWGLGLSTSIANILNASLLLIFLNKKVKGFKEQRLFHSSLKIFIVSFITAFALYIPMKLLDQLVFDTTRVGGLLLLTIIASLFGFAVYFFLSWLFRVEIFMSFSKLFERAEDFQKILRGKSLEPIEVHDESTQFHS